jgi:hypothetical protein
LKSGVEGRLDVGGTVAVEAGGGDGLREDDADGDEDGAGAGSERDGDLDAGAFGILIAAAKAEAAFGEILAKSDFFLEAAAADASENAGFDARAIAAGNDAVLHGLRCSAGGTIRATDFGNGFDPDRGRVANAAVAGDAFADFERLQLNFIEIDDFAALAEAALHEKASKGLFGFLGRRKINVPKLGAGIEEMNGIEKMIGRVLVNFRDHAGASVFPEFAFKAAAEVELLAHGKFFREAEDAAIAADEHGFGHLSDRVALRRDPGGFHGHAEADAVTLAKAVGFSSHSAVKERPAFRLA